MSYRKTLAVLLPMLLVAGLSLSHTLQAEEKKATEGIDYSKWTALTPEPVAVHKNLFTLCTRSPAIDRRLKDLEAKEGPHFVPSVKFFANPEAEKALKDDPKGTLPVGSVIVKEKFSDFGKGSKLVAYGAMIKREKDYDPENGDWEYLYADLSGEKPKIERGKIASCIRCHSIAKERDYLYRTHLTKSEAKSDRK